MITAQAGPPRRGELLPEHLGFSGRETAATLVAWIKFHASVLHTAEPIEQRFYRLANQWKARIGGISDPQDLRALPAFAELVQLGIPAVSLVIRELDSEPSYWFEVLADIAGEDPTPPEHAGDVGQMILAWKRWAGARNLL